MSDAAAVLNEATARKTKVTITDVQCAIYVKGEIREITICCGSWSNLRVHQPISPARRPLVHFKRGGFSPCEAVAHAGMWLLIF